MVGGQENPCPYLFSNHLHTSTYLGAPYYPTYQRIGYQGETIKFSIKSIKHGARTLCLSERWVVNLHMA